MKTATTTASKYGTLRSIFVSAIRWSNHLFFQSRSLRNAGGFFFCVKIWMDGILVLYLTHETNKHHHHEQLANLADPAL